MLAVLHGPFPEPPFSAVVQCSLLRYHSLPATRRYSWRHTSMKTTPSGNCRLHSSVEQNLQVHIHQDSPDQCPMPINADQNHGIDPKCLSMPINADQYRLRGIDRNWSALIGIDRHWSELIDIGINAMILIGIDRYWSAFGIDRGSPDTCISDNNTHRLIYPHIFTIFKMAPLVDTDNMQTN